MGWKESEEAASHTYFVQPKGKSTSGPEDPGQLLYPKSSRCEGSLANEIHFMSSGHSYTVIFFLYILIYWICMDTQVAIG